MRDLDRISLSEIERETESRELDEFPLPVAEDWDGLVHRSNAMTETIDRHLDFESRLQGRELKPVTLCPEQKVSLASDLAAV